VVRALEATGTREPVKLIDTPAGVRDAARVIVPGQGAFGDCAAALRPDAPLGAAVLQAITAGKPYLGICLGLQILFEDSEESSGHPGLGLYRGHVRRLPGDVVDQTGRRLKVPHIGWSPVAVRGNHPVLDIDQPWFYFVHSYQAIPDDESLLAAVAPFGEQPLTAAVGARQRRRRAVPSRKKPGRRIAPAARVHELVVLTRLSC